MKRQFGSLVGAAVLTLVAGAVSPVTLSASADPTIGTLIEAGRLNEVRAEIEGGVQGGHSVIFTDMAPVCAVNAANPFTWSQRRADD